MKRKILLAGLIILLSGLLIGCRNNTAPDSVVVDGVTLFKSQLGYTVTSYEGNDKILDIPESYKGVDIVRIHFIAFTNTLVEEINIPKTLTGFYGLWRTFNLKKINVHEDNPSYYSEDGIIYSKDKKVLLQFPQNHIETDFVIPSFVEEINNNAFIQTRNLNSVEFHDDIEVINDLTFQYSNIKEVVIPDTSKLKSIGELAFDHTMISNITLPESLETIGSKAFNETYISEIKLGKNIKEVNESFEGMQYLENIEVDELNSNFIAEEGILYNKTKTSLLHYPRLLNKSTYQLPASVLTFENDSISNNMYLRNINTNSLNFKSSDGILYNNGFSEIIVYPKLNQTEELQIGINLSGIEDIENIANSLFLKRIVTDPSHPDYFSKYGVLYNRTITELLIYPKSNLIQNFNVESVVERIRYENFNPTHLKHITVDSKNKHFSSVDGVLYNNDQTKLLLVPESKDIEEIQINKNVNTILDGALNNSYLREINVVESNPHFYSIEGVLYQKVDNAKSILIKVPTAKEIFRFRIPKEVFRINENAFYYQMYIEELDFSNANDNLSVADYAIVNILNLNNITININSVLSKDFLVNDLDNEIEINIIKNSVFETLLWDLEWYKKGYIINVK